MYKSIKTYDGSTFNSCFDTKENAFVCYRDTNSNADPQRPKPLIKDVESGWLKTPGKTVKELPFCSWYKGVPIRSSSLNLRGTREAEYFGITHTTLVDGVVLFVIVTQFFLYRS